MTEEEGRGLVLKHAYDLAEIGHDLELADFDALGLPRETIARHVAYLKEDARLLDGWLFRSKRVSGRPIVRVVVKINSQGRAAVENPDQRTRQIVIIDQSINLHGVQNAQIGNNIRGTFNTASNDSTVTTQEGGIAKSPLASIYDAVVKFAKWLWLL